MRSAPFVGYVCFGRFGEGVWDICRDVWLQLGKCLEFFGGGDSGSVF